MLRAAALGAACPRGSCHPPKGAFALRGAAATASDVTRTSPPLARPRGPRSHSSVIAAAACSSRRSSREGSGSVAALRGASRVRGSRLQLRGAARKSVLCAAPALPDDRSNAESSVGSGTDVNTPGIGGSFARGEVVGLRRRRDAASSAQPSAATGVGGHVASSAVGAAAGTAVVLAAMSRAAAAAAVRCCSAGTAAVAAGALGGAVVGELLLGRARVEDVETDADVERGMEEAAERVVKKLREAKAAGGLRRAHRDRRPAEEEAEARPTAPAEGENGPGA